MYFLAELDILLHARTGSGPALVESLANRIDGCSETADARTDDALALHVDHFHIPLKIRRGQPGPLATLSCRVTSTVLEYKAASILRVLKIGTFLKRAETTVSFFSAEGFAGELRF